MRENGCGMCAPGELRNYQLKSNGYPHCLSGAPWGLRLQFSREIICQQRYPLTTTRGEHDGPLEWKPQARFEKLLQPLTQNYFFL